MDSEEYRKKLEREILKVIKEKLMKGQMDSERAKAIAHMVLQKLLPPLTLEQIHQIAPSLDDEFRELTAAVLFVLEDHDEEVRKIVSEHAEKLIKSGKFDEAHAIIKDVTQAKQN